MVKGILGSLAVHVAAFLIVWSVAFFSTNEYQDASDAVRLRGSEPVPQDQVMFDLADAFAVIIEWLAPIFLVGFICTVLFIVRSDRAKGVHTHRADMLPFWAVMLFVNFLIALALMYAILISPEALLALLSSSSVTVMALGIGMLLLAYWISTILFVKKLKVPSVPLAQLFRGI